MKHGSPQAIPSILQLLLMLSKVVGVNMHRISLRTEFVFVCIIYSWVTSSFRFISMSIR